MNQSPDTSVATPVGDGAMRDVFDDFAVEVLL
jgi:hypothetical protein